MSATPRIDWFLITRFKTEFRQNIASHCRQTSQFPGRSGDVNLAFGSQCSVKLKKQF